MGLVYSILAGPMTTSKCLTRRFLLHICLCGKLTRWCDSSGQHHLLRGKREFDALAELHVESSPFPGVVAEAVHDSKFGSFAKSFT